MGDLKKYLIGAAVFAATAAFLSRVVPGVGAWVGLTPNPIFPSAPFPLGGMQPKAEPASAGMSSPFKLVGL